MRTRYTRTIATATALATGGLAVYALRPPQTVPAVTAASRNTAVVVRTQIIRRTIRIIRHEPGAAHPMPKGTRAAVFASRPRARTSGAHSSAALAGAAVVSTRTSGSHAASTVAAGAPVSTRTSGSHAAPSTGTHVTTRTSGSHGSTGTHVTTRASGSGGGEHEGGDGGSNGGDD